MQSHQDLTGWRLWGVQKLWRTAAKLASWCAWGMMKLGAHKQIANRILEPFQMISVVVTATDWNNFFELRCHPDAQPEMQELALEIKRAFDESTPRSLQIGEWHMPYVSARDYTEVSRKLQMANPTEPLPLREEIIEVLLKISVARCARTSYKHFDGTTSTIEQDVGLYEKLLKSTPCHSSPAEHQAKVFAASEEYLPSNLRGWNQLRKYLPNEWVPD